VTSATWASQRQTESERDDFNWRERERLSKRSTNETTHHVRYFFGNSFVPFFWKFIRPGGRRVLQETEEIMFASMNDEIYADFYNYCPCRGGVVETSSSSSSLPRSSRPSRFGLSALLRRYLQSEEEPEPAESYETWEIAYTSLVLMWMFVALLSDKLGADSVMLIALTAFMASEIITIEEGLVGFSNEGLMSVLVLFVVAEGISKTGYVRCGFLFVLKLIYHYYYVIIPLLNIVKQQRTHTSYHYSYSFPAHWTFT
jgi:uncharacterized membrane protein